jgi:hypothetical protein
VAGIFKYAPISGEAFPKAVLFFSEPSHFALSFLPFFLYAVIFFGFRMKVAIIFFAFLMVVFLENLTLAVGVALTVVITFSFKKTIFFLPIFAIPFLFVDVEYYSVRLNVLGDTQNLSTLVYMQGWERAYLNLKESYGIGVGFQQFGIVGSLGEIMKDVVALTGKELNLLDGGSLAPKIVGEFGMLGIFALLMYFIYFFKKIKWLHSVSLNIYPVPDSREVFFVCCFLMFSIDLFIRGIGYFSSSGFLFVASLIFMSLDKFSSVDQLIAEAGEAG